MRPLPHGWTDQYAVRYLVEQNERLMEEIAFLKGEVKRLDAEKQGRRGPKPTARGNARSEITQ